MKPIRCVNLEFMLVQSRPEDEDVLFRFATLSLSPSCGLGAVPNLPTWSALVATSDFPFILSESRSYDAADVALSGNFMTRTLQSKAPSQACVVLVGTFLFQN
jgi:hypothetical protein